MKKQEQTIESTHTFSFETPILPWREQCEKFMCAYFEHVLAEMNGNVAATSRLLKMNRTHFYKLVKQHGIRRIRPGDWLKMSDDEMLGQEEIAAGAEEGWA
jgi:DNA-binding NtrC family response regulator